MNYFALIFILLIAALFIYTGARLGLAIQENFGVARRIRQQLASRIRVLRMFPMLKKRGIDMDNYLNSLPIHEIERQLRNCENCEKPNECDSALGSRDEVDYSFCPNDKKFKKFQQDTK